MSENGASAESAIRWDLSRRDLGLLKTLLQGGVGICGRTGISVRDFLSGTLAIDPRYIQASLQTVFVDRQPVDDLDATRVVDGCTLALSGAMPGLAGATMRRGGALARMRGGISHRGTPRDGGVTERGVVHLKLFNQPLSDLVETFALRPLGIPRPAFSDPRLGALVPAGATGAGGEFVWLKIRWTERAAMGAPTVRIRVKCFASLAEFQPPNAENYPVPEGTTVGSVIEGLAIPRTHVHLVFLNHAVLRKTDVVVEDGDEVGVFPAIGGG